MLTKIDTLIITLSYVFMLNSSIKPMTPNSNTCLVFFKSPVPADEVVGTERPDTKKNRQLIIYLL